MASIKGKLVYKIPKWRIAAAKCVVWPIAWAYAFDLLSDSQIDRIMPVVARFMCGDIRRNSRVEWE